MSTPKQVLILSDIHGNLDALEAALSHIEGLPIDALWCLGDITGYGPEPDLCIQRLRHLPWPQHFILGNHDRVVSGLEKPIGFNPHAIAAAFKHRQWLDDAARDWLAALPIAHTPTPNIGMYHGSPLDPDDYLLTAQSARPALVDLGRRQVALGLCGHTHVPCFYELDLTSGQIYDVELSQGIAMKVHHGSDWATIINPGSIGQPRDGDPRASFAILDMTGEERWSITFHRVPYDIATCQKKMLERDLPGILSQRLTLGF